MKTIHQYAKELLHIDLTFGIYDWADKHPHCPSRIAAKIIAGKKRAAMKKAAHAAVNRRETAPDYSHIADRKNEMTALCKGVRRVTGMSGSYLRRVAHCVRQWIFSWGLDLAAMDSVPDSALEGIVGEIRSTGVYHQQIEGVGSQPWSVGWAEKFHAGYGVQKLILMALADATRIDIGELWAKQTLSRIAAGGKISGYMADDMAGWMAGKADASGNYERCSGGETILWFRKHPEHWGALLAASPIGVTTPTALQVYPHEHAKTAACRAAGLFETLRLSDFIFSGSADQVAKALELATK